MGQSSLQKHTACYHCGEDCGNDLVFSDQKNFCCQGCKMVYEIINKNGLCDYYEFSKNPGASRKIPVRKDKFSFLDDEKIKQLLFSFSDDVQSHVVFYLPQIHCSSCLWLLENLHKLNPHILYSKVNFNRKEATVIFEHQNISLRQVAEMLTSIGYEPYFSYSDMKQVKPKINRSKIYKVGVAGFCFANIMLFSFPEYLGIDAKEAGMLGFFRIANLLLSLPVFFYSASEFYISAWKSLQHKFLNIDAPIVLAIWVTFGRSIYEVITNTGGGYFDSMSGIVFFMLVGRILQDKTHEQLNFDRDYTSYFPMAVTRINNEVETTVSLPDIKLDDTLLIHQQELVPADGILTRGTAWIDYSFVTGESMPVRKEMGEIVYAGGRQTGNNIELLVIKEVSQSYLTQLWNREDSMKENGAGQRSFVHIVSRYFTWVVFSIAIITAIYWANIDQSKIWNSVTAVLIIACPCALLLANTFTNGNILRIINRNKLYLRKAETIELLAKANHIVFDKTGTLTTGVHHDIVFVGIPLHDDQKKKIAKLASQSVHPLSKAVAAFLHAPSAYKVEGFFEKTGQGIEGIVENDLVALGSRMYVSDCENLHDETAVYVSIEDKMLGKFVLKNHYRKNVIPLIHQLKRKYPISILSGDNAGEKKMLENILGRGADIRFKQMPGDKLETIRQLQLRGKKVIMIGDGLNDAGALQQANVGIAVSESSGHFTPASDAIIDAESLPLLSRFITMCKANKIIVVSSFIISIIYNLVGIYFAVQGNLSPVIAAILMPASSISILLITFGSTHVVASALGLQSRKT